MEERGTIVDESTVVNKDCLTSRTVLAGAVVPEESNRQGSINNEEIENRTKIMMSFMDDLTNIYFSTRNSLKLSVENGSIDRSSEMILMRIK